MSEGLAGWEPSVDEADDVVTVAAVAALHGLLDAPGPAPAAGESVPPLWHWLAFLPRAPQRELGPDGHPRRGTFLPPVALPGRMFAGGRLTFAGGGPLVGAVARRSSSVVSVEEKSGRSGELVFVTVRHELSGGVVEEQDLVYREPAAPMAPDDAAGAPPPGEWAWAWDLPIDPTLLFRFSALTYNAHRIHYDRAYATAVEGYPGLVVHGPLQAVALAELCRRHAPTRSLATFRFRALRPAFDDGPLQLRGTPGAHEIGLAAHDHAGRPTMTATATFAD